MNNSVSVAIPEACMSVMTSEARVVKQEMVRSVHLLSLLLFFLLHFFLLLLCVCPCDNV